mmetsp:Transcript_58933/g.70282  ORF Transcript_58933/g.70282 Transcript_58933/m.70282 type:complete len:232 (+) Transcript_58933:878-1573(+)
MIRPLKILLGMQRHQPMKIPTHVRLPNGTQNVTNRTLRTKRYTLPLKILHRIRNQTTLRHTKQIIQRLQPLLPLRRYQLPLTRILPHQCPPPHLLPPEPRHRHMVRVTQLTNPTIVQIHGKAADGERGVERHAIGGPVAVPHFFGVLFFVHEPFERHVIDDGEEEGGVRDKGVVEVESDCVYAAQVDVGVCEYFVRGGEGSFWGFDFGGVGVVVFVIIVVVLERGSFVEIV